MNKRYVILIECVTTMVFVTNLIRISQAEVTSPANDYRVGLAKIDITPEYPIRLNGFGFRREESVGVTQRIWAKALAVQHKQDAPVILLAIDSLGVRFSMVEEVFHRIQRKRMLDRSALALTFSHSHTTPKVNGAADNIFSQPIPEAHQKRIDRYTNELTERLEHVALNAIKNLQAGSISWVIGKVTFAENRRTKNGPVDHDLPTMVIRDSRDKVIGIYTSYACHCVTLSDNKISGDWAGFAQELIERRFPGAIALVSIGAGSDSNPDSGVTGDRADIAAQQGAQIADEVVRLTKGKMQLVAGPIKSTLNVISLPLDPLPTRNELVELSKRDGVVGYNAKTQLLRLDSGKPLIDKIDYPMQSWTFGDDLAMTFLAGEVCVDYSIQLKAIFNKKKFWLNAYSNDFCSYIPSERLLREGGYGGGAEIPYFALPATIASGVEKKIIEEAQRQVPVRFQAKANVEAKPKSPADSLKCLQTHDHLRIELAAAEPLIADPVAIDFAPDGGLWVVEMNDYARGPLEQFPHTGRVRKLIDKNQDGRYDTATTFVDGLRFPTDVKVWRDGILVCDAPAIWFMRDTDGDGVADKKKKLFTGFATHNAQARVNSLRYGLDNWVYGACGLFGGQIENSHGQTFDCQDRDFRCQPDTGVFEPYNGQSQQGRCRDDWDHWFGCTNSALFIHFPVAEQYFRSNPHVQTPASGVFVPSGKDPNRLYPASDLVMFQLSGPPGRPTSACGAGIYRDRILGDEFKGNGFVCEPVNQLVRRFVLKRQGVTFEGARAANESDREFLTSRDNWFRPVQVRTGLDGALWVVDMYRYVIEHPVWIPEETKATLNVFAGKGKGRIYRIVPNDSVKTSIPRVDRRTGADLARKLDSANGVQRDLVQQLILWNEDIAAAATLKQIAKASKIPEARSQALWTLSHLGQLSDDLLQFSLADPNANVVKQAIRISEIFPQRNPKMEQQLIELVDFPDVSVQLQLAYSLRSLPGNKISDGLSKLLCQHPMNEYLRAAVFSSAGPNDWIVFLRELLKLPSNEAQSSIADLVELIARFNDDQLAQQFIRTILPTDDSVFAIWQLRCIEAFLKTDSATTAQVLNEFDILSQVKRIATDSKMRMQHRISAIRVLGRMADKFESSADLLSFLEPSNSPSLQRAAIESLGYSKPGRKELRKRLPDFTPKSREITLHFLGSTRDGLQELMLAVEAREMSLDPMDANLIEKLRAVDPEKLDAIMKAAPSQVTAASFAEFRQIENQRGNPIAGKMHFVKHCRSCHRYQNEGNAIGPDLAALSNKTTTYLLNEILNPSLRTDVQYHAYVVVTVDGRVFNGIVENETGNSIELVQADGTRHSILRVDVESIRSTRKSLMPDGFEKQIQPAEMSDLIAFLQGMKK